MTKSDSHSARISPHQALIYAMILVAGSDRDITDRELRLIGRKARQLPVFDRFDENHLPEIAQECAVIVHTKDGVERVIALIAEALPANLRETCYLCAAEVAAIDGRVPAEELRVLQRRRYLVERQLLHCFLFLHPAQGRELC